MIHAAQYKDPATMTPEERVDVVCAIMARGLNRLLEERAKTADSSPDALHNEERFNSEE